MPSPESRARMLHAQRTQETQPVGDFHNLDYLDTVLVDGTEAEQEAARVFLRGKGIGEEKIERMFAAQRLRAVTHQMVREDRYRRVETNPDPTPEEMGVGCYREMLEPQVRDAVFSLLAKGYPTRGSGFTCVETQEIYFADEIDLTAVLDEHTKQRLADKGVEVTRDSIRFVPKEMSLESIKEQWDDIVACMPVCTTISITTPNPMMETFQTVVREGKQQERWGRKIKRDQDTMDQT